jgi:HK97 family phage prohead protease
MLTKNATIELKAGPQDGLDEGQFVAYASVFGNVDSYGDIVTKGAFTKDLQRWEKSGNPIPLLFGHNMADPDFNIGHVIKAEEDNVGLKVTAQLDLENPKAKQVYRMLKGRRINQMSFAYDVVDGSTENIDGEDVYQIRDMKLYEVSVVTVGANQETEVLAVKQMPIVADRLLTDVKAGRVLSAKNESELRSAHEALGRVLSVLDSTPDEQKASEPDPSRQSHDDTPVKSAPTVAPEVEGDEIEDEDVSEEEIREASPTPSVDYSALPDAIFGEVLAEIA